MIILEDVLNCKTNNSLNQISINMEDLYDLLKRKLNTLSRSKSNPNPKQHSFYEINHPLVLHEVSMLHLPALWKC